MFVSSKELFEKIYSIKANIPSLIKIFCFDDIDDVEKWDTISSLATTASETKLAEVKKSISPDNLTTMLYIGNNRYKNMLTFQYLQLRNV